MDQYHTSALALQKHLLNLRQELVRLKADGQLEKADHLAGLIAHIELTLADMASPFRSPTLQ
ncbi:MULTISPECIES: hypothetical protein [Pseudomonas]|uniref:Uncharacterized protein n=1 Tax=Pseudomonas oryziphila TaxID=2894079 RepID=A0ABN5THH9_9PSED|nr:MULTISPECIES: hypothetical protein [Pseudomonas]AZL74584.1 hypothetical protein EI693_16500 [Pseudomonas oryziphila]